MAVREHLQALVKEIKELSFHLGQVAERLANDQREYQEINANLCGKQAEFDSLVPPGGSARILGALSASNDPVPLASRSLSPSVKTVVDFVLSEGRDVTPSEVAEALGIELQNARQRLWRATKARQVVCTRRGKYGPVRSDNLGN